MVIESLKIDGRPCLGGPHPYGANVQSTEIGEHEGKGTGDAGGTSRCGVDIYATRPALGSSALIKQNRRGRPGNAYRMRRLGLILERIVVLDIPRHQRRTRRRRGSGLAVLTGIPISDSVRSAWGARRHVRHETDSASTRTPGLKSGPGDAIRFEAYHCMSGRADEWKSG